jgi:acyl-coenzyme A thioesterase PaaI-like protein
MESDINPIEGIWTRIRGYNCFGCAPKNEIGLNLKFYEDEHGIHSNFNLDQMYSSYPGVVHCGIVATILEEMMGNVLVIKAKRLGFTLRLSLKYIGPVLTGKDYSVRAKIKDIGNGFPELEGRIYDEQGGLIVKASGIYKVMTAQEAMKVMDINEATASEFSYLLE